MPNTKAQILGFRRSMRTLAHTLAREQGMNVGGPQTFTPLDRSKMHTCEKAPPAFQKEGDCAECAYEILVKARLTNLLGEPVSQQNG